MQITQLVLENFKSYTRAQITFQAGTNAILGANGAGKSTLLEAIGFALFNHAEAGMSQAALLSEGAAAGRVVVGFLSSRDDREYEVERCFGIRGTTRYRVYDLELGRQVLADGVREVERWLRDHLRVEATTALDVLFRHTVGVPQGTFTAAFLEQATDRKKIFDPLLQVDDYKRASDALLLVANHLRDQAADVEKQIAGLEGQLAVLPHLCAEEETLTRAIAMLAERITALEAMLQSARAELEGLDRAEAEMRALAVRVERAQAECEAQAQWVAQAQREQAEAEAAQARMEATRSGHAAYLAAEERLRALEAQRAQRDALRAQLSRLETAQARLKERLVQLEAELAAIAADAERMETLAPLVEKQRALEAALRQAEEKVMRLESAQRRAREAQVELAQAHQTVERQAQGWEQAQALQQTVERLRAQGEAALGEERTQREARAATLAELERLRKQSEALRDSAAARCPVCEAELTPAHRDDLLARNAQRLQELSASAAAREAELQALVRRIKTLNAEQAHAQKRLHGLPTAESLRESQQVLAARETAWQQAQGEADALAEAPARAQAHRRELEDLGSPDLDYHACAERVKQGPTRARERQRVRDEAQELAAQIAQVGSHLRAFATLDADSQAAHVEREQNRHAYETHVTQAALVQSLPARRARVQQAVAEHAKLDATLRALLTQHAQAQTTYDAARHTEVKAQVAQWQMELAGARAQRSEKAARQTTVRREIARLEAVQGTLVEKRAAHRTLQELRAAIERVRGWLREAGPYVTQQLVRQISWEASALYSDIMSDHTGYLEWSEDYELALEVKGLRRAFRQLSGGEQMSAALALRLALLRKTSAIDVAFFDEPTAHLDPLRREGLAEKIMQVKGFRQLFVISHDDTFEHAAQNYIRIVKDAGGSHPEGA